MDQIKNATIADAIVQLEQLCRTRHSGTLFFVSSTNMMGQMILMDGDVINIRYLRDRGVDALKRIFETDRFKELTFMEKESVAIRSQVDSSLPSRGELFSILRRLTNTNTSPPVRETPSRMARSQPVQRSRAKEANPTQLIETVSAELAIHIGPMAPIICRQQLKGVASSADILKSIDKIASVIDDPIKANAFKQSVKEKI